MQQPKRLALAMGLVLMLVFTIFPASAGVTLTIDCGDEAAFTDAITMANVTSGHDTIEIEGDCAFSFTAGDVTNSDSALPRITAPLTINGNGATLQRADMSPEFRFFYTQSAVTINDLTLQDGYLPTGYGGAVYAAGNTRLNNVTLLNNQAQYGGGAYTANTLTVVNSSVLGNSVSTRGGGLENGSATLYVINSIIAGNGSAGDGAGIGGFGAITVTNSVVVGNKAIGNGGGIFNNFGTTTITTSTIADNAAASGGGVYNGLSNTLNLSHSIVWGNNTGQITHVGSSQTVSTSIVEGGYVGTDILDNDPLFVDSVGHATAPNIDGDYHILIGSPAIDAGGNPAIPDARDVDNDSDTSENHPIDIDGETRILQGALDLGADEVSYCEGFTFPYTVSAGDSADLSVAIRCANANSDDSTINLSAGTYTFTGEDSSENGSALPTITTPIILVGNNATIERDDAAPDFRLLSVSLTGNLNLTDVTLTGGYLTANEDYHGALVYNLGALWLERVTLADGFTDFGCGGLYSKGTLTIRDSTVRDNESSTGGGICLSGATAVISNTAITGNIGQNGGGIYAVASTSLALLNSSVVGNSATTNGGGVLANLSTTRLVNTIVSGNTSVNGAVYVLLGTMDIYATTIAHNSGSGLYNTANTMTVSNSIIWGNSGTEIVNTPTVSYSIVEGGFAGTGNLNADPLFINPISTTNNPTAAGDYHLQTGSPAINVGNNAALPVDTYDIDGDSDTSETLPIDFDGDARSLGIVDMGADEVNYCSAYTFPYTVPAGDSADLAEAIACANASPDENTINLSAGTYTFTSEYELDSDTALPIINTPIIFHGNGAILARDASSSQQFRLMHIQGAGDVWLEDITFKDGELEAPGIGAAIQSSATLTVVDSVFTSNTAYDGGAIANEGSLVVINSEFTDNTAMHDGGAILTWYNTTNYIANSTFKGNSAVNVGGAIASNEGVLTLVNSTLSGNQATLGGALHPSSATVEIINSTIAGNLATDLGGGIRSFSGVLTLKNTILWGNNTNLQANSTTVTVSNSIVQGGYAGTGNLDADPLFVDPIASDSAPSTAGDYHIQSSSPAIDAGSNAALPVDTYDVDGDSDTGETLPIDMDGDARVLNDTVDIGADETLEVDACVSESVYTVPAGDESALLLAVTCANANADANVITLGGGTYTLTAEDTSGNDSAFPNITTPITINGNGATIERDASASNFRFFRVANSGDLTLNDLTLTGGLITTSSGGAIYSSGGAIVRLNRTSLSGNTSMTNDAGGFYNDNSTVILIDSTVSGNTAPRGAGLSNQAGQMTLINSTISGNTAEYGGGIFMQGGLSQVTLINSVISGNTATIYEGGGMTLNSGTATIINSTIAGNHSAVQGGGIYSQTPTVTLTNSIVWGNSSQIVSNSGSPIVTYSIVEGGFTGTGNLSSDPLFVTPIAHTSAPTTAGNYELQDASPAINVGSNAALPVDTYDLDGDSDTTETLSVDLLDNTRVVNFTVDMGAYENGAIVNRLTNGSFETTGTTAVRANKWTNTKTKTADKRLCSTVNKPITTADGDCVFQFSGGNTLDVASRAIKQVINAPVWGDLGGSLTLSAKVEGNKFKTGAVMFVQVTYADNTKGKVQVAIPSGTYAFTLITTDALDLTQTVSKAVVTFKIGRTGGRLRIDDVQLILTNSARSVTVRDGALPLSLPEVPDGFRDGN